MAAPGPCRLVAQLQVHEEPGGPDGRPSALWSRCRRPGGAEEGALLRLRPPRRLEPDSAGATGARPAPTAQRASSTPLVRRRSPNLFGPPLEQEKASKWPAPVTRSPTSRARMDA